MSNNSMARAYGEQFNLSTEEIIKIIEKIYKLETIDNDFKDTDIEVALYNYDYYVRPGVAKENFMNQWERIFSEVSGNMENTTEMWTRFVWMFRTLKLIKDSFDEEYFKEQVKYRRASAAPGNKDKLRTYLKKLDKDQLESFLETMVIYRRRHGLFISETSSTAFWKEIHDACRSAGCNVPMALNTPEGTRFLANNKAYYFKCLNKNTIANMLFRAIDLDVALAGTVAKKLYTRGYREMIQYLDMKLNQKTIA